MKKTCFVCFTASLDYLSLFPLVRLIQSVQNEEEKYGRENWQREARQLGPFEKYHNTLLLKSLARMAQWTSEYA